MNWDVWLLWDLYTNRRLCLRLFFPQAQASGIPLPRQVNFRLHCHESSIRLLELCAITKFTWIRTGASSSHWTALPHMLLV